MIHLPISWIIQTVDYIISPKSIIGCKRHRLVNVRCRVHMNEMNESG